VIVAAHVTASTIRIALPDFKSPDSAVFPDELSLLGRENRWHLKMQVGCIRGIVERRPTTAGRHLTQPVW
jgi:hypothetical protein